MLEVTDDSGFLALIDPDAYRGFVAQQWELGQLAAHFRAEMVARRLLIWGTGLEGFWRVEVRTGDPPAGAFREVAGPITSSAGRLLLTNYESLTMAAGYRDVTLPEEHDRDLLISVPPGGYVCLVQQVFDPEADIAAGGDRPDFVIALDGEASGVETWSSIPWCDDPPFGGGSRLP